MPANPAASQISPVRQEPWGDLLHPPSESAQPSPRPSTRHRKERELQRGKEAPPRESAWSSDNISVGELVAIGGWSVVGALTDLPPRMVGVGIAATTALGVWEKLKARSEGRATERRPPRPNRKGEPS